MAHCDNWDKECSRYDRHVGCLRPLGTSCPPEDVDMFAWFGVSRSDFFKEFGMDSQTIKFYHDYVSHLSHHDRKIVIARLRRKVA